LIAKSLGLLFVCTAVIYRIEAFELLILLKSKEYFFNNFHVFWLKTNSFIKLQLVIPTYQHHYHQVQQYASIMKGNAVSNRNFNGQEFTSGTP
jgi:hypothetical protein